IGDHPELPGRQDPFRVEWLTFRVGERHLDADRPKATVRAVDRACALLRRHDRDHRTDWGRTLHLESVGDVLLVDDEIFQLEPTEVGYFAEALATRNQSNVVPTGDVGCEGAGEESVAPGEHEGDGLIVDAQLRAVQVELIRARKILDEAGVRVETLQLN